MRLHICAVGRLRAGPEQTLIDDYLTRAARSGRNLGLGPCSVHEVEDKKGGGPAAEAALLTKSAPQGAAICLLDERGKQMTSPGFAHVLAEWRDAGRGDAAFMIGGADGHDPALRARADLCLSFGKMVWPHMLARAMLAEQLYRAVSILAGSPYHRV
ncbi:23S rRNA (pseudouridine(1915)-N(3))-methyltransferase RlmH [Poseidonocella sedimentorum]|uniref:Ribosomal RNA large subunit methyltransferase H n=1 Tax=Poseidonocella sedimentorum TaxID=871652 RepID=A0A1I6CPZ0_9RHOB|nr:23S rRNA (pseudouridine(1915)-N(3))-methyltransferase RlmH [Poseidonocella sedimentorum]SFQ95240.1 23S rRNA (pseudouridine1915-N3)-methyltransferase [Poseidonocella sedimentorum]